MRVPVLDPVRGQRLFVAGLVCIFAAASVQYSLKVMKPRADGYTNSAILRWAPQLRALDAGENIAERYNYPNPPIMALMLSPLADLPPLTAALIWFYLKLTLTLIALAWTFRLIETPEQPFPPWAKALTLALSLRMILSDLSHGNVNLFIMFLMVASLYAFRRGRDHLSGNLLGLAIACKVTPALFIGYFLWKRSWGVLIGCAVGLFLYLIVVPSLDLGFYRNWELLSSWFNGMVKPFLVEGFVTTEHNNQSLPGLVYRLFTDSPSFSTYIEGVYTPTRYDNVLSLSLGTAQILVKGAMVIFALAVIFTCRAATKPASVRAGWPLAAEFALIMTGMLLFSERTWKHHAVTLMVPFAVLCYALAVIPMRTGMRRTVIASLVIATLGIASTSSGMWGNDNAEMAQVYGGFTLAFIVLAVTMIALMARYAPPSGIRSSTPLPNTEANPNDSR